MPHHTHESSQKKRKAHPENASSSKKKSKISSSGDSDSESEFNVVKASLRLSIPPIFANNPRAGVEEMLDSMIMRYIPAFRGVVLSHSSLSFTNNRATIRADCPFLVCDVRFDATIWSPKIGIKLVGRMSLCSPDHVSLLIHKTFNASIPRHHIPGDEWEFQYGPAENDPEFGPQVQAEEGFEEKSEHEEHESAGKWVDRRTGQQLGGEHGDLEFTVIGLTVANEMLSLQGSIQSNPFSPEYAVRTDATGQPRETETEAAKFEDELEDGSEADVSSDVDTFRFLGQKVAQAAAADKQKQKSEISPSQTEASRKKKRKSQKEDGAVKREQKRPRKW